jgi:gliding motility-associated-like protein
MTIDLPLSTDGAYNISCAGEKAASVNVKASNGVGNIDYLWSDGGEGSSRTNLSAGVYGIIIIDDNNCQAADTITLTEPDHILLSFDVTKPYCPDKPDGEIRLAVSGGVPGSDYSYLWSDNSTTRSISNIPADLYDVTVTDANFCTATGSVQLSSEHESCLIMSDVISPNGDLTNDVWNIGNISSYPNMEITIYNRWGQSVWKSGVGYPVPWDGKSNGTDLPIDSYHYVIDLHNGSKPIIGDITIVR